MTKAQEKREATATRNYRIALFSAICSALISVASLGYQIYKDRHTPDLPGRLGRLETGLRLLTATTAPQLEQEMDRSLQGMAVLPGQSVSTQLQIFQRETANLRALNAPLSQAQSKQIGESLRSIVDAHQDLPTAWQASAEFISFRSGVPTAVASKLPSCFSLDDQNKGSPSDYFQSYSNCVLDLNDLEGAKSHDVSLFQKHPDGTEATGTIWQRIRLSHGVVVYRGGPLVPLDRLICEDCRFDFSPPAELPPSPARRLSEYLLTADINAVDVGKDLLGA